MSKLHSQLCTKRLCASSDENINEATSSSWVGLLLLGLIGVDIIQGSTFPFPAVVTDRRASQIHRCYPHTRILCCGLGQFTYSLFLYFYHLKTEDNLEVLANMFKRHLN